MSDRTRCTENVTEKKAIAPSAAGGNDLAAIFNDDVGFIDFLFEIRRLPLVNMLPWPLLARNCLLRLKVSPLRRAAYSGGHVVIFAPCGPIQILRKNGSLLLWRRKISARELGPRDYRKIISISKPEGVPHPFYSALNLTLWKTGPAWGI